MSYNHEVNAYYYINKKREYLDEFGVTEKYLSIDLKLVTLENKIEIPEFIAIPCIVKTQVSKYGLNCHGYILVDIQTNKFWNTKLGWISNLLDASLFDYYLQAQEQLTELTLSADDTYSPYKILTWKVETNTEIAHYLSLDQSIWFEATKAKLEEY